MNSSMDFIQWLGEDLSVTILTLLDDPADLVRTSAVSSSWRRFDGNVQGRPKVGVLAIASQDKLKKRRMVQKEVKRMGLSDFDDDDDDDLDLR